MYVCLAVTWHFHFWQNDRDLLRVTALTRGLNGYRNESTQKVDPGEKKAPAAMIVICCFRSVVVCYLEGLWGFRL